QEPAHTVRRVHSPTRAAPRALPHPRTEATHRAHPTPETRSRVEAQITGHAGCARRSPILSRHIPTGSPSTSAPTLHSVIPVESDRASPDVRFRSRPTTECISWDPTHQ